MLSAWATTGLTIGLVADIAFDECAAQLLGHGCAFFGLHVCYHNLATVGHDHAGCAFTQARRATGNDEYLACNVHENLLLLIDVNVNVNYRAVGLQCVNCRCWQRVLPATLGLT
jgi:hypothetical protein